MTENHNTKHLKFWHVLLGIFILLILTWIIFYMRARAGFEAAMDKVRADGYPITLAELNDSYSIGPDEENAADIILDALQYYNKWDDERAKPLPIIGEKKLAADEPYDPNTLQLAEEFLTDNKEMIGMLEKAAKIKHARYPIDLTQGLAVIHPPLGSFQNAGKVLSVAAGTYAEKNKPDKAIETLETMKAVSHSLAKEPLLISQLVLMACDAITIETMERVISRCDLSDTQLNRLASLVASMQAHSPIATGLIGERCMLTSFIADGSSASMAGGGGGARFAYAGLKISGMAYNDGVVIIEIYKQAIDACKLPLQDRLAVADAIEKRVRSLGFVNFMVKMIIPAVVRVIGMDTRQAAKLQVAQTAIAAELYKRKTGKLPANLTDLTGEYLKDVPVDPFDGKPLRYRKTQTGFIIYSIGTDKTDDGGSKGTRSAGDITFQIHHHEKKNPSGTE